MLTAVSAVAVVGAPPALNAFQLARGWAKVYVFRKPFARLSAFRIVQRRARRADRGVWGLCGGDFHAPA